MIRWYLALYKTQRGTPSARYCSINDDAIRIRAAGATVFQEVEVLGGYGLVAIDARQAIHDSLSGTYIQLPALDFTDKLRDTLSERERRAMASVLLQVGYPAVEIRERLGTRDLALDHVRFSSFLNMLRTRRLKPRYDTGTDTIILDGPIQRTNPLPFNPSAFGASGVLDNFTRADENPLGNGLWSGTIWSGLAQGKIVGNQVASASSGFGGSYISTGTYGPDVEIHCQASVIDAAAGGDSFGLLARITNPGGGGTMDGYMAKFERTRGYYIVRIDDNATTQLGSDIAQSIKDDDQIGFELIGANLRGWIHEGTSWAEVGLRTDSTYTAAGTIGFLLEKAILRMGAFSGATLSGSGPVLTVPGAQTADYGDQHAITGISATDTDTNIDEWELSCSPGMTLAVNLSGDVTIVAGSNSSEAMTLNGSQADLNTVIGTLFVNRIDPGVLVWDTVDTITIIVRDATEANDTDTIQVTWTPASGLGTSAVELTGTSTQIVDMLQAAIGITPPLGFEGQVSMGMHAVTALYTDLDIVDLTIAGLFIPEPHPVPSSTVKVYIGK